ncbi:MAG: 5-(carboxyamino)imidazole ribonucleotide synthase [Chromatiales bacterium]|nr:5-(carboxyamino)imidazole ribonucleotide synthase [Chromatiales bacterium]
MRIGVIGAGQLGRMLALAGYPLGMRFMFLDRSDDTPAAALGGNVIGAFDDPASLAELVAGSDIPTFEFENVPAPALETLPADPPLWPPASALQYAQDRLHEKNLFAELDIASAPSRPVDDLEGLRGAVAELGLPAVLKTRRLGYDGKGQTVLHKQDDIDAAWEKLGDVPLLLEKFIPFDFEVSLIGVRSSTGETVFYPLTRNHHEDGILRYSLAPFEDVALESQAQSALNAIMSRLGYVGVLTVEFFVSDGRLLANEMAPRVHNSGHWTIEGAVTSQFENHLRAIAGLPLGGTTVTGHSAMINFIGSMPDRREVLALANCHLHDYGKSPRPGRKLGHATAVTATVEARDQALQALRRLNVN